MSLASIAIKRFDREHTVTVFLGYLFEIRHDVPVLDEVTPSISILV